MKKLVLSFFLISSFILLSAQQEWAPTGAKWYYHNIEGMMPPAIGYIVLESTMDTFVNQITYKVIKSTSFSPNNAITEQKFELTRYDSGKVYSLYNNKEYLLYNFNLLVGDTFKVYIRNKTQCHSDTFYLLRVDTVGEIMINNEKLKYQYLSTKDSELHGYNLKIYERFGCTDFMFPHPDTYCIADNFEPGPLRCYYDSTVGYYNRMGISCDTVINETEIAKEVITPVNIFPNPVKDGFYIKLGNIPLSDLSNVKIFNLSGIEILSTVLLPNSMVDISKLSPSIYVLKINYEGKIYYTKLIKH